MQDLPPTFRRRRGITLPELALVLFFIGLLAAMMLPNYLQSVYYAKRTESYYALRSIHDLQAFHYLNERAYSNSLADLGFQLDFGSPHQSGAYQGRSYVYSLDSWPLGGRASGNFRATASGNIDPSDVTLDILVIGNALTVKN